MANNFPNITSDIYSHLTPDELQSLDVLRQWAHAEGLNVPDPVLVHFLMARKFEPDRALSLLKNHLCWKRDHESFFLIDQIVIQELETCKILVPPARDKAGAQIIYFRPALHKPKESPALHLFKMCFFLLQRCLQDIVTQRNGFLVINDLRGAGWSNFDHKVPKLFVNMLQNRFPGRLHQVLHLSPPKVFKVMLGIVRPFVPEKYQCKMVVINMQDLSNYVDHDQLLEEYGGSMQFNQQEFIQRLIRESQYQFGQSPLQQIQQQPLHQSGVASV